MPGTAPDGIFGSTLRPGTSDGYPGGEEGMPKHHKKRQMAGNHGRRGSGRDASLQAVLRRHAFQEFQRLAILDVEIGDHADVNGQVTREAVFLEPLKNSVPVHGASTRGDVVVYAAVVVRRMNEKGLLPELFDTQGEDFLLSVQVGRIEHGAEVVAADRIHHAQ